MPIPHIFSRSRRAARDSYREPANAAVVARTISAQLGRMIDRADGAELKMLSYLLECARIEAERALMSEV